MSKELEALELLRYPYKCCNDGQKLGKAYHTIKSAFKRLNTLSKENNLLKENLVNLDETYFETWYACERLKENSNYALMFVDDNYRLVDTKDNKFEVIDNYEVNSKGIIDEETKKKLKAFEIIIKKKC